MNFVSTSQKLFVAVLLIASALVAKAQNFPPTLVTPTALDGQVVGTNPWMTVYNNVAYIVYATNNSNVLSITGTSNGTVWTGQAYLGAGVLSNTSPAAVEWNNELWITWISDGGTGVSGALYVAHTPTPLTVNSMSTPVLVEYKSAAYYPSSSPTMFVNSTNNELNIVTVHNTDSSDTEPLTLYTSDGSSFSSATWCSSSPLSYKPQTGAVIGATMFNGKAYYTYQTQGGRGGHYLEVCQSPIDTITTNTAENYYHPGYKVGGGTNATVWGNNLIVSFKDYNSHNLVLEGSPDGANFTPSAYSADAINGNNQIAPGATALNNSLYVAFTQNSGYHGIYVTHSN